MQLIPVLWIALFSISFIEDEKWLIDPESRLTIHGTTNVSNFKCMFDCLENSDTLEFSRDYRLAEIHFSKSKMTIPVRNFDCGNRQISRDFWHTLKSEAHPNLDIIFRKFKGSVIKDNSSIEGVMDIVLAGTTKRYIVKYQTSLRGENTVLLKGTQVVHFADFKLSPPKKMMGLIQVQENLEVEFNLVLKPL